MQDLARPMPPSEAEKVPPLRKPDWLKVRAPGGESYTKIKGLLKAGGLNTVCEEARCPNISECWASGTATFMVGSDVCTRACRFCAVKTARIPPPLNPEEPMQVARAVAALKLKYVVLTTVDRDDLADGGAGHIAKTISSLKALDSKLLVEALVSDYRGNKHSVQTVVDSGVDVYAHNIETVERLQYRVRDPRAGLTQSLQTLRDAKEYAASKGRKLVTKSSIMLGLGETEDELEDAFRALREAGVDILTLGQYLRPTMKHLPVEKYVTVEEFEVFKARAEEHGFLYVAAGPMVRSSYRAAEFFIESLIHQRS
jgi:lipoyl synthase